MITYRLEPVVTRLTGDIDDLLRRVEQAKAAMKSLGDSTSEVNLQFGIDKASLAKAETAARVFVSNAKGVTVPVGANLSQVEFARVLETARMLGEANPVVVPVRFDASSLSLLKAALARGAAGGGGGRGAWGWLANRIPLFGGAATIGGLHLLIDLFAEVFATIIPATIALAAFGAAAAPTIQKITQHLQTMNTVIRATGQYMYPLNGGFQKVANAVKPEVYVAFGDVLSVVTKKMGTFSQLAQGAGHAVDGIFTRAALALNNSSMSSFFKNAASDLARLFDVIGNIAGTIGNLLKGLTPAAGILLGVLQGVTHALETFTGWGWVQGLLKVGLAMHGAWIYGGLLLTGLLWLRTPLINLAGNALGLATRFGFMGEKAVAVAKAIGVAKPQIAVMAGNLEKIGATAETGAAKTGLLSGAMNVLKAVPVWGWVALGAAAIGGLVYWIVTAKDDTQKWIDTLSASIDKQTTFAGVVSAISSAQLQITNQLSQAHNQLATATSNSAHSMQFVGRAGVVANFAVQQAQQKVNDLTAGQQQFNQMAGLTNWRLAELASRYGSTNAALGLFNLTGIKASDIAKASHQQWATDMQTLNALSLAYQAMGQHSGTLGADMYVLGQQADSQYQAMQKLNQAWSTFLGLTSSLQTSATSVITDMRQLTTDAGKAGASFQGVNANSITLRNDFEQNLVPSLQNVINGLRTGGASSGNMAKVIATFLNPAVHAGALENQTMKTQIYDMARQAGYAGPNQIASLKAWIDKFKTSLYNAMQQVDRTGAAINNLPANKPLTVSVSGYGTWTLNNGVSGAQSGKSYTPSQAAAGWLVHGGIPGKDSVPILAMPGELVVPTHMVQAGAVDHLRGRIPGFAAGGIVPNYKGNLPGLTPWIDNNYNATVNSFAASLAGSLKSAIASAVSAGSTSGGNTAAEAIGQRMAAAWGWTGGQWQALKALWMRESGWNPWAINPSSGAYGIPQALGHGHPFNLGDIAAQVAWGLQYIGNTYTLPSNAWAHEMAFGWYDRGGYLRPGWTMAYNGTGQPEPVGAAATGGDILVESVVYLDSKEIFRATQKQARKYQRRNGPRGSNKAWNAA